MNRAAFAIPALAVLLIECGPAATSSTAEHRAVATVQAPLNHGSNAASDISSSSDRPSAKLRGRNPVVGSQPPPPRVPTRVVVPPPDSGGMVGCGNTQGKAKMMCAPG